MKKNDTLRIERLASRALADLIEGSALSADSQIARTGPDTPTVARVPEYRLAFRMDERKDAFSGKPVPESGRERSPEIYAFVAAAFAIFMLVPALAGGSRPTIEHSMAAARDSGELAVFAAEFKDTMIQVSQTLHH